MTTERLSRDNPKSRWHQEDVPHGRSSWACVPLTDAIEAEARASLDVERLARAMVNIRPYGGNPDAWALVAARDVAAEYERLSRP